MRRVRPVHPFLSRQAACEIQRLQPARPAWKLLRRRREEAVGRRHRHRVAWRHRRSNHRRGENHDGCHQHLLPACRSGHRPDADVLYGVGRTAVHHQDRHPASHPDHRGSSIRHHRQSHGKPLRRRRRRPHDFRKVQLDGSCHHAVHIFEHLRRRAGHLFTAVLRKG